MTADDVLVCDLCRCHIGPPELSSLPGDRANRGWLLWSPSATSHEPVRELVLTCASCEQPEPRHVKLYHSLELTSAFAAPQRVPWHLARLHVAHRWTAEQARRLVLIAWAVSATSTKSERYWCHQYTKLMSEL